MPDDRQALEARLRRGHETRQDPRDQVQAQQTASPWYQGLRAEGEAIAHAHRAILFHETQQQENQKALKQRELAHNMQVAASSPTADAAMGAWSPERSDAFRTSLDVFVQQWIAYIECQLPVPLERHQQFRAQLSADLGQVQASLLVDSTARRRGGDNAASEGRPGVWMNELTQAHKALETFCADNMARRQETSAVGQTEASKVPASKVRASRVAAGLATLLGKLDSLDFAATSTLTRTRECRMTMAAVREIALHAACREVELEQVAVADAIPPAPQIAKLDHHLAPVAGASATPQQIEKLDCHLARVLEAVSDDFAGPYSAQARRAKLKGRVAKATVSAYHHRAAAVAHYQAHQAAREARANLGHRDRILVNHAVETMDEMSHEAANRAHNDMASQIELNRTINRGFGTHPFFWSGHVLTPVSMACTHNL